MHKSVELQPAFIIHSRNFRETSQLVDFITPEYGRVSAVAKGVKRSKLNKNLLHPFSKILISWHGKGELKTLGSIDQGSAGERLLLQGNALLSGLYINELLSILLRMQDNCETLFDGYQRVLQQLASCDEIEPYLRCFEKLLLQELGYGIPFPEPVSDTDNEIDLSGPEMQYYYNPESEFELLRYAPTVQQKQRCFSSKVLNAICADNFQTTEVRQAAKRLMRLSITPLLGGKALRSRELFRTKELTNE